jgi:hypothetical protein
MEKGPFDMWSQFLKSDESKIREFRFEPHLNYEALRDGTLKGNVLESNAIWKGVASHDDQSSVRALDLHVDISSAAPSYALLFEGMTCHESKTRLSKFTISALDETVVTALSRFLPHS